MMLDLFLILAKVEIDIFLLRNAIFSLESSLCLIIIEIIQLS